MRRRKWLVGSHFQKNGVEDGFDGDRVAGQIGDVLGDQIDSHLERRGVFRQRRFRQLDTVLEGDLWQRLRLLGLGGLILLVEIFEVLPEDRVPLDLLTQTVKRSNKVIARNSKPADLAFFG